MTLPRLIQGGMGVAVSGWRLARAVSAAGHLGVVSGTALDVVMARRLQQGDPGGDLRRALDAFPARALAQDVLDRYFVSGGIDPNAPFASVPMFAAHPAQRLQALAAVAGFAEVFLAREGHSGVVGINFLEKVQLPTPAVLYGALLAGVDYVLVGAGIPRDIPALLDALVRHEPARLPLHVTGAHPDDDFATLFDPHALMRERAVCELPALRRPFFLPIVSSATLAVSLARKAGGIDGFIVEGPVAGGHNAPPRGPLALSDRGEPTYGPRDEVDLERMRRLGLPFWLAGGQATPAAIRQALARGAAGIQVGTLFAFCEESGIAPSLRHQVLDEVRSGTAHVFTDPLASPTGFPFKVVQIDGTLSEPAVSDKRERRCDLGYLREIYRREDGTLGYRCAAEPVGDFVRKGGSIEETRGRKCVCNGLLGTVDLGQRRFGGVEPAIVTAGATLHEVAALLGVRGSYSAADVVAYLTSGA